MAYDIDKKEFEDILDTSRKQFLDSIYFINNPNTASILKERYFRHSIFPMFNLADTDFYKRTFYHRYIEHYFREIMLNRVIQDLFIHEGWHIRENINPTTFVPPLSTKEHEQLEGCPFEYIIESDKIAFGVRYSKITEIEPDNIAQLYLRDFELDYIIVVHWCSMDSFDAQRYSKERDNKSSIKELMIEEFFKQYFPSISFAKYESILKESLKDANDIIGLRTIAQYQDESINSVRKKIEIEFKSITRTSLIYRPLDINKNSIFLSVKDFQIIHNAFINKKYYQILTGTSNIAKSFMTSEYLMQVFDGTGEFDYTSIVAGYFKAVELALYQVALTHVQKTGLYIKKATKSKIDGEKKIGGPDSNIFYIPFKRDNIQYFDTSLGALKSFFSYNKKHLLNISTAGFEDFIEVLGLYTKECRNDNFHKDIINDWSIVERIRNNTLFILTVLIGSSEKPIKESNDDMGIIDNQFDQLYRKIIAIPVSVYKFVFKYKDGTEVKAIKLYQQDPAQYDEFGTLMPSKLYFAKVSELTSAEYDKVNTNERKDLDLIVLDKDSIPDSIQIIVGEDTRKTIL